MQYYHRYKASKSAEEWAKILARKAELFHIRREFGLVSERHYDAMDRHNNCCFVTVETRSTEAASQKCTRREAE